MANQDNNPDGGRNAGDDRSRSKRSGGQRDGNNEWLQDQMGEDHNLAGSDTYRTLPDQPAQESEDRGARDASDRQSNR